MSNILANEPEQEIQLSMVTGRCVPCGGLGKRDEFPVCPDCSGTGADRAAIETALVYSNVVYPNNFVYCHFAYGNAWDVSLDLAYNALKLRPDKPLQVDTVRANRPFLSRTFKFVNIKGKQIMQETRWLRFHTAEDNLYPESFEHNPKPLLHYPSSTGDSWQSYTIPEPIEPD